MNIHNLVDLFINKLFFPFFFFLFVSSVTLTCSPSSVLLQAQQSPTTGKFQFLANVSNNRSSTMMSEANNNPFDDNSTSFAFRPSVESGSSFILSAAASKVISLPSPQKVGTKK